MKKIIGFIVIVLLIPVVIKTISNIDKTPIYNINNKVGNIISAFIWIIPVLLVGGLIYLSLKRKK